MPLIEDYLKKQHKIYIEKNDIHYKLIFSILTIITVLILLLTPIGSSTIKEIKHKIFLSKQSWINKETPQKLQAISSTPINNALPNLPTKNPLIKNYTAISKNKNKSVNKITLAQKPHPISSALANNPLIKKSSAISTKTKKPVNKLTLAQVSKEMNKLGFFKEPVIELLKIKITNHSPKKQVIAKKPPQPTIKKIQLDKPDNKTIAILPKNIAPAKTSVTTAKSIKINPPDKQHLQKKPIQLAKLKHKPSLIQNDASPQMLIKHNKNYMIDQTIEQAINYMRQGKDSEALTFLNSRLVIKHADYRIYQTLAGLYLQANNLDQALRATIVGLRKFPQNHHLLLIKARVEEQQNKTKLSLKTLTHASPELVNNLHYYAFMAKLYLKLQRPNIAISLYKKLLNHKPTQSSWWLGLGLSYEANNNYYLAQESFKKAQEIGSTNPYVDFFLTKKLATTKGS